MPAAKGITRDLFRRPITAKRCRPYSTEHTHVVTAASSRQEKSIDFYLTQRIDKPIALFHDGLVTIKLSPPERLKPTA